MRLRAGVAQELLAAVALVVLADAPGRLGQRGQGAQEAAVGLVLPRHRAVALPAVAPQQVEAAVVADARVGVGRHVVDRRRPRAPARRAWPRRAATPGGGVRRRGRRRPAASSSAAGSAGSSVGGGPAIRSRPRGESLMGPMVSRGPVRTRTPRRRRGGDAQCRCSGVDWSHGRDLRAHPGASRPAHRGQPVAGALRPRASGSS